MEGEEQTKEKVVYWGMDWSKYRYFSREEFDSPDEVGSGDKMNEAFINHLHRARVLAQVPFKINSGYRTPEHNRKVGGKSSSSHLKGLAADIHCTDGPARVRIIAALIDAGFRRIGIAKTFIHVDNDSSKNDSIWLY